jgi:hypothetical protein
MPLEPAPAPTTVNVSAAELKELQSAAAQYQQLIAQKELEATAANIRAAQAAGETEALARQHRQNIEAERARAASVAKKAELAQALAGRPLVPGAASQLSHLWNSELHADATTDGFAVRTAGFQDVNTFVTEQLARPEYSHFLANSPATPPATRPATPGAAAPATPTPQPEPVDLGSRLLAEYQQRRAAQGPAPDGRFQASRDAEGRKQPMAGFGLRPLNR